MAMFVALALGGSGCGGMNASQSVSPLNFLLPGIIRNSPPATPAAPDTTPVTLASVR